ncbi:hypothetical protein B0T14DRAFT_507999 [Immersiella caudata]|uniref:Uncharacterized protein n=1 Tax=Immersiella caudata TaxID=314043 RepID=A0AA39XH45_9PEZI|nr:hypothetical protein B0T14DRAFT_507999 [Immersiella caudata]
MNNATQTKIPPLPELVELAFGRRPSSSSDLKPYYSYYQRQWGGFTARHGAGGTSPTSKDFAEVVEQLKNGASRDKILANLEAKHQGKGCPSQALQDLVDLAACALTMVQPSSAWTSGSLQHFLSIELLEEPTLECEAIKFHNSFDAWHVENLGGIVVEFTDNLADHLRLVNNGGAVLAFHHVSLLQFLEAQPDGGASQIPPDLVKETLQTLSLLFPKTEFSSFLGLDSSKAKWLKASIRTWEGKPSSGGSKVDTRLFRCAPLPVYGRRVESYRYWRDRLVLLKQKCDEGTVAGKASKAGLAFTAAVGIPFGSGGGGN